MWDERYAAEEYAYGKEPNDFLAANIARIPPGKVLCLCDGEGRNGVYLAQQGCQVTSVDASAVGLAKADALARERGVSLDTRAMDLAQFVIAPKSWDAIISIFCHVPPQLRAIVHQQCVAGLRPGGILILEAYTPKQLQLKTGGPQNVEMTMTLAGLEQELKGLDFVHALECERQVIEGRYHHGTGAVVQVIGIKP
ncbi:MAG: class I SAM-dependent methyltransferase [Gammaproteobacteria bacterium]|nr:class I SAM-dependent methyltransferase [Gammaproteobacteria bacterium]